MANTFKLEFEDGVTKSVSVEIKPPKDVIMFVAGTTDPINLTGENHQANNKYWKDSLDNFWAGVKKLKPQYLDLHIEDTFFSWSGDNNTSERNKAAKRLLDLFLRVYKNWTKKEVHLHLIGHSHGGNVINQFTELIAKDDKFPKQWRIKSITYLSTPFFKEKHQLVHDKIHPKCKIINVHNEYDITQRFVADFTLYNLENVINKMFDGAKIKKALKIINLITSSNVYVPLMEKLNVIDNHTEGPLIWERTALLISNVGTILDEIIEYIDSIEVKRLIAEKAEIRALLVQIRGWATATVPIFRNNVDRTDGFNSWDFGTDLNLVVALTAVNQLLAINRGVEDSYLLGLLERIFSEDTGVTDSIDDTSWTPKRQVEGKYEIQDLNITIKDIYDTRNKKLNYEGFATGVEESISNNNLREVLMRLFSQFITTESIDSAIDGVDNLEYIVKGRADALLKILRKNLLPVYRGLVNNFNADLIAGQDQPVEVAIEAGVDAFTNASQQQFNTALRAIEEGTDIVVPDETEEKTPLVPGTIPYLATVSHSLSHTEFWKEVEDGLRNSFSSGKNPGYKG